MVTPTLYALANGHSHKALANALNTDAQRVKRWLHHLQPLPAAMALPLAKVLALPVETVLLSCRWEPSTKTFTNRKPRAPASGRPVGTTKAAMRARFQDPPP